MKTTPLYTVTVELKENDGEAYYVAHSNDCPDVTEEGSTLGQSLKKWAERVRVSQDQERLGDAK